MRDLEIGGFEPAIQPPETVAPDGLVFAFAERRLLVCTEPGDAGAAAGDPCARVLSLGELEALAARGRLDVVRRQFLGWIGRRQVHSAELAAVDRERVGAAYGLHGLRGLFGRLEEPLFWLAARAVQIVAWDRDHQFCGRCGAPTVAQAGERSRACSRCDLRHYPRLAPAVIVLIHDGDRLLLARSRHFPPGMYSTLAGFVEPGESLEQTIRREIREEVGVEVAEPRYFGSQPWPFPNSLMIGFLAAYAGGDLRFTEADGGDGEIEHAAWFPIDALPPVPPRISIARAMIDAYQSLAERPRS